jgi:putative sterol carrier protein
MMAAMTPKEIFEGKISQKLKDSPDLVKDIGAVLRFEISGPNGGTWTVDLTKPSDWIKEGPEGTPKMSVLCSDEDFVKIISKELNPQMAALQGKLRFKPMDMALAMKLGKLF